MAVATQSAQVPRNRKTWTWLLVALVGMSGLAGAETSGAETSEGGKAAPDAKGPVDISGDPLPQGAVTRLGTVRFRYQATSVAYSPNGKILAAGGTDNHIRLIDAATGKEIRRLTGHQARTFDPPRDAKSAFDLLVGSVGQGNVTTLAFSPDGQTLASGGWDDSIRLWEVATGTELRKIHAHQAIVARVVFSADGKLLASRGGLDGLLRLWDAASGKELHKIEGLSKVNPWRFYREAALAFSPDSKTVVASDRKGVVFFDVASGKEIRRLEGYRDCMYVAFSPDGKLLATGGLDDAAKEQYSLRLWDAASGKELRRCELPKNEPPTCFAFSPEADKLAAAVAEADTCIFDVASGKPTRQLKHFWPYRIAFSPDGKTVVSIRGPVLRRWDAATGEERLAEIEGHQAGISCVAISRDGSLIVSGGEDIRIWEPKGKLARRIASPGTAVALSADGKTVASVGGGGKVAHLWDATTGEEIGQLEGPALKIQRHQRAVAFSSDGKLLATGDEQATVRIWDLETKKQLREIDVKSGAETLSLAFSPDGKTLACAGAWNEGGVPKGVTLNLQGRVTIMGKEGYLVLLWNVATGEEVRRFAGLKDNVQSVVFSRDGKTLAAASRDGRICLWEAATGKELLYIEAHPRQADGPSGSTCLAFSPDGKKLASAGADKAIHVWDAATAKPLGKFVAPDGVTCVAFAPDGKTLVTGSTDTTAIVWDLAALGQQPKKPHVIVIPD
jgi:WD40 repeat protein